MNQNSLSGSLDELDDGCGDEVDLLGWVSGVEQHCKPDYDVFETETQQRQDWSLISARGVRSFVFRKGKKEEVSLPFGHRLHHRIVVIRISLHKPFRFDVR